MLPSPRFDVVGVRVPADAGVGLEEGDAVTRRQHVGGDQAGDAAADDGDRASEGVQCFTATYSEPRGDRMGVVRIPKVAGDVFRNGTIWTGTPDQTTDAVLVVDGVIDGPRRDRARRAAADVEEVDLDGGFLMPSFGDGHAHPLLGGLESVGPPVRPCTSVDEIVDAVRKFADEHPDDEWIVGASYDSSLAPDGLFDARWLDAAVPDRPVVLRAWDYHTVWCNSVALERAGDHRGHPGPGARRDPAPRRRLGARARCANGAPSTWCTAVMPQRDRGRAASRRCGTAADYYLARGVTWVQDAWVEPADVDTYVEAARRDALRHPVQPRRSTPTPATSTRSSSTFAEARSACRGARRRRC